MRRQSVILLSAACLAFSVASASAEDTYPNRPIKVIVPYDPGGATDIVARVVGNEVAKITGQGFVIINKPGAYGLIAVEEMAKLAPDGHTLMIGNVSTNAITPVIYKTRLTINYERDVVPVTRRVDIPAFLLVTTKDNFPVTTVRELVAYVKKNPGKVVYGTVGVGSYSDYDLADFAKRAGDLAMVALPNKNGASAIIPNMLRGNMQVTFLNVVEGVPS